MKRVCLFRASPRLDADEMLVAQVYDAIHLNDLLWRNSLLVITYFDHGGFFDHVVPPDAAPDGFVAFPDVTGTGKPFLFDRLGVRVPAIIVSAYGRRARWIIRSTTMRRFQRPSESCFWNEQKMRRLGRRRPTRSIGC